MVIAERGMTNQGGNIHRRSCQCNCLYIIAEPGIKKFACLSQQIHWVGQSVLDRSWSGTDSAVANDDSSDALREFREHLRTAKEIETIVRMHIDKARRQRVPATVAGGFCCARTLADCFDFARSDADASLVRF